MERRYLFYGDKSYYLIAVPNNSVFTKRDNIEVETQSTVAGRAVGAASIVRNDRLDAASLRKRQSPWCGGTTTSNIFYHADGGYFWGDWELVSPSLILSVFLN
jgi:hypothetical protein